MSDNPRETVLSREAYHHYTEKIAENQERLSEWFGGLAVVLLTFTPIFLISQVENSTGVSKHLIFWFGVAGLMLSLGSLYLGLLFRYYKTKAWWLSPDVQVYKLEPTEGKRFPDSVTIPSSNDMVVEIKQLYQQATTRAAVTFGVKRQVILFISGLTLIVASVVTGLINAY